MGVFERVELGDDSEAESSFCLFRSGLLSSIFCLSFNKKLMLNALTFLVGFSCGGGGLLAGEIEPAEDTVDLGDSFRLEDFEVIGDIIEDETEA